MLRFRGVVPGLDSGSLRNATLKPSSPAQTSLLGAIAWNGDGLVPAIVQEAESGEVLMMAWMNEQALRRTMESGQTFFYSRSRCKLWHKGETSGHVQQVASIAIDCDGDVLLIKVRQVGGACHEGYQSCFFRRVNPSGRLEIALEPVFDPCVTYTQP